MDELKFEDYNKGMKQISVNLPLDLWLLAKKNLLEFKDTLIFGIKFKMAEKDPLVYAYPPNTLSPKIIKLQETITNLGEQIYDLEEK